jgi:hypothetical protein
MCISGDISRPGIENSIDIFFNLYLPGEIDILDKYSPAIPSEIPIGNNTDI